MIFSISDFHSQGERGSIVEKPTGLSPDARDRLRAAVESHGGPTVVAQGGGVPKSTLDKYLGGHSEPPATRLASIATFCGVTVEWIITGKRQHPDAMQRQSQWQSQSDQFDDVELIPRLNVRVSAGIGMANQDGKEIDRVPISRALLRRLGIQPERAHIIQADGDSMEETIFDQDDVLVDTGETEIRSEGIYAVQMGELAMIKRVQPMAMLDTLTLYSDNERYAPMTIKRGEVDQFRVIGRAKLVMRVL